MADKNNNKQTEGLRLQVYLAKAGVSVQDVKCEEYISEGRVTCRRRNGILLRGSKLLIRSVSFDGRPVFPAKKMVYIALNKPVRYLCTATDPEGRPTAIELVRKSLAGPYLQCWTASTSCLQV